MNNGLSNDGSDNGVPMKNQDGEFNTFAKNHWAIDAAGHIATDPQFANNSNTTIQARIIGIREDIGIDGKPIGLTMMTTHALSNQSAYETDSLAKYG